MAINEKKTKKLISFIFWYTEIENTIKINHSRTEHFVKTPFCFPFQLQLGSFLKWFYLDRFCFHMVVKWLRKLHHTSFYLKMGFLVYELIKKFFFNCYLLPPPMLILFLFCLFSNNFDHPYLILSTSLFPALLQIIGFKW